jgi:two-component system, chemotaxis family, protein-glutamate methylesterase/glutaminase
MTQHNRDIIVVGASAGGVQALQRLVAALPGNLSAAIFVVLHVWPGSQSYLPAILSRAGPLPVSEAVNGAPIERGTITVAAADMHLMVENERVIVVRGPRENRARPAINPLFRSAAMAYRERVIGVILTGTLDDGAAGLWAIKQCGGLAIVQSDAAFDEMPRSAVENVQVDHHVPLVEIPVLLRRLTQEAVGTFPSSAVPEVIKANDEVTRMKPSGFNLDNIAPRSLFTCPECNGALWELETGGLQYRCHVGHAYSANALKQEQYHTIEQSLWSAVRALKESAALDERLAERSRQHNLDKAEEQHRNNASEKLVHVAHLQAFLTQLGTSKNVAM